MNKSKACILFDGYPRNKEQASQLDAIFSDLNMKLSGVIAIMVDPEVLITRITARRSCGTCGMIVNLALNRLENVLKCPNCSGELEHRDDDNEIVVRRRIESYHDQTEPLLSYYQSRGLLHPVEGLGSVSEVRDRVNEILAAMNGGPVCPRGMTPENSDGG